METKIVPLAQRYPTVVLANGEPPTHHLSAKILRSAKIIVCCDGAAKTLLQLYNLQPTYVVGDMDSLDESLRKHYEERHCLHHEANQEANDLSKAIQFCAAHNLNNITILGASGKREDHLLGNMSLLADYAKIRHVQLLTNYGALHAIRTTTTFASYAGQQVSIFSLAPNAKITTHNLRYPINHRALTSWWMGTLNEACSNTFTIEARRCNLLVYRLY